jgi:hypothetical protein
LKCELAQARRRFGEQVRARHVGRHQVGRALHARELQVHGFRECPDEQGLAESRRSLDERMPLAEEAQEQVIDERALPDEHPSDLGLEMVEALAECGGLRLDGCGGRGHGSLAERMAAKYRRTYSRNGGGTRSCARAVCARAQAASYSSA